MLFNVLDSPCDRGGGVFDVSWSTDIRMKALTGCNDSDSTAFQFRWNRTFSSSQSTTMKPDNRGKLFLADRTTDVESAFVLHAGGRNLDVSAVENILDTNPTIVRGKRSNAQGGYKRKDCAGNKRSKHRRTPEKIS